MPNATMIPPEPAKFQGVITSTPCPTVISDRRTRTIVRRLPTETTTGPQTPNKIWKCKRRSKLSTVDNKMGLAPIVPN
jgi:hypothetical protein